MRIGDLKICYVQAGLCGVRILICYVSDVKKFLCQKYSHLFYVIYILLLYCSYTCVLSKGKASLYFIDAHFICLLFPFVIVIIIYLYLFQYYKLSFFLLIGAFQICKFLKFSSTTKNSVYYTCNVFVSNLYKILLHFFLQIQKNTCISFQYSFP